MKKYELLLILPGTLEEKEAETRINEVMGQVEAVGQSVVLHNLGKIRLAYPIKQIRYGYFYTIVFEADPNVVPPLQEKLRLRTDVLRAIISYFNTNLTATKKIMYTTNEAGVTTMTEKTDERSEEKVAAPAGKVDLREIDRKLNDLLDSDIISGV